MSDRKNVEAIYPLSPQQEGMLFETLRNPDGELFIEQETHELTGPLNVQAFREAWQALIARHAMLRTAFVWQNRSEPLQVVLRKVDVPFEYQDWRGDFAFKQRQRLEQYLNTDRAQAFELGHAPLLRIAVFQTRDDAHQLVWTQHHILYDGWCRPLLFGELATLYQAYASGTSAPASVAPQYSRYLEWLRKQDVHDAEQFWRKELAGVTGPTPPGSPQSGALTTAGFDERETRCPAADTAMLDAFVRDLRVTAGVVVQALWATLLSRYSGQQDVVFGATVSGRPPDLDGVEEIVGPFMNTLPVRVRVNTEDTIAGLARTLHAQSSNLRRFEYCSSGQIHTSLGLPGSVPLYEAVIVFENYPSARLPGRTRRAERDGSSRFAGARTPYPFTMLVAPGSELVFRAVFNKARLVSLDAGRILDHMVALLRRAVREPDCSLAQLMNQIPSWAVPAYRTGGTGARSSTEPFVAAATPVEEKVASIAAELLGLERVSMADRFLQLGGHSLLAAQFVTRLRGAFAIDVPLRFLFESESLRALATTVQDEIVQKIQNLSDEEASRLLAAMGQTA